MTGSLRSCVCVTLWATTKARPFSCCRITVREKKRGGAWWGGGGGGIREKRGSGFWNWPGADVQGRGIRLRVLVKFTRLSLHRGPLWLPAASGWWAAGRGANGAQCATDNGGATPQTPPTSNSLLTHGNSTHRWCDRGANVTDLTSNSVSLRVDTSTTLWEQQPVRAPRCGDQGNVLYEGESLFTGVGEYDCLCVVSPEGAAQNLINVLENGTNLLVSLLEASDWPH